MLIKNSFSKLNFLRNIYLIDNNRLNIPINKLRSYKISNEIKTKNTLFLINNYRSQKDYKNDNKKIHVCLNRQFCNIINNDSLQIEKIIESKIYEMNCLENIFEKRDFFEDELNKLNKLVKEKYLLPLNEIDKNMHSNEKVLIKIKLYENKLKITLNYIDQNIISTENLVVYNLINFEKYFEDISLIHCENFKNFFYLKLIQEERNNHAYILENKNFKAEQSDKINSNKTNLINQGEFTKEKLDANPNQNIIRYELNLNNSFNFILENLTRNEMFEIFDFRLNLIKYCKNTIVDFNNRMLSENFNKNQNLIVNNFEPNLNELIFTNTQFIEKIKIILNSFLEYFEQIKNEGYFLNFHDNHVRNYILFSEIKEILYFLKINYMNIHKAILDSYNRLINQNEKNVLYLNKENLNLVLLQFLNHIETFVGDFIFEINEKIKFLVTELDLKNSYEINLLYNQQYNKDTKMYLPEKLNFLICYTLEFTKILIDFKYYEKAIDIISKSLSVILRYKSVVNPISQLRYEYYIPLLYDLLINGYFHMNNYNQILSVLENFQTFLDDSIDVNKFCYGKMLFNIAKISHLMRNENNFIKSSEKFLSYFKKEINYLKKGFLTNYDNLDNLNSFYDDIAKPFKEYSEINWLLFKSYYDMLLQEKEENSFAFTENGIKENLKKKCLEILRNLSELVMNESYKKLINSSKKNKSLNNYNIEGDNINYSENDLFNANEVEMILINFQLMDNFKKFGLFSEYYIHLIELFKFYEKKILKNESLFDIVKRKSKKFQKMNLKETDYNHGDLDHYEIIENTINSIINFLLDIRKGEILDNDKELKSFMLIRDKFFS